ncbi:MAG TPA: biotin/lipoyl-containing protein, partial [Kofleriaceae bacterium]|nr:biotin/lipoyl-containing protein [Kofleriaceae bacterium]
MPDLVVPALGESITEAVISRWHKKIGDRVEADEPVVALETDKITVELPAPAAGALTEQRFAEGDTVKVGDVVGTIGAGGEAAVEKPQPKAEPAPEPVKKAEAPAPAPAPRKAEPPPAPEPAKKGAEPARGEGGNGRALSPSMRRRRLEGEPVRETTPPPTAVASTPTQA